MALFDIFSALANVRPNNSRVVEDSRRSGQHQRVFDAEEAAASALGQTPVGCSIRWWGEEDPAGGSWMVEDGRPLAAEDFPELFAVVGNRFSRAGDAAGTFRIPDSRSRTGVGADPRCADRALGGTFGSDTQRLSITEIPGHSHGGSTGSDTHSHGGSTSNNGSHNHNGSTTANGAHRHNTYEAAQANGIYGAGDARHASPGRTWQESSLHDGHDHNISSESAHDHSVSTTSNAHGHSIAAEGGGLAHNNVQPSISVNYVIRIRP